MASRGSAPKLFSLEEAQSLLPMVCRLLKELRAIREQVDRLEKEKAVEELCWLQPDGSVSSKAQEQLKKLDQEKQERIGSFESALQELARSGAQLKDLDQGLVDFFTPHGDQIVYLCWKEGEGRIAHWHDLESGFPGRRPLEELE